MTRTMEKMFSVSSLEPGGARVTISPEISGDRQILRFMASLSPDTKVEVKFRGKHVAGSPYTYHVPPPAGSLATSVEVLDDGVRRMKLFQDLERAIADAEKNVPDLANNKVENKASVSNKAVSLTKMINKEAPSTSAKPSAPLASSVPASAPGIDFSAVRWREVGFIHPRDLGGQPVGLCLLKNGHLVVATMEGQVKMFNSQLKFHKEILGKDGQEFERPWDMTLLYNGNFALKVFNISDIHANS